MDENVGRLAEPTTPPQTEDLDGDGFPFMDECESAS